MLPTSAGVEPATWSAVGRRTQLSHWGRQMYWVWHVVLYKRESACSSFHLFVHFSFSPIFFVTDLSAPMRARVLKFCIHIQRVEQYCVKENHDAEIYFAFLYLFFSSSHSNVCIGKFVKITNQRKNPAKVTAQLLSTWNIGKWLVVLFQTHQLYHIVHCNPFTVITKTRLFKYTENFTTKKWQFFR